MTSKELIEKLQTFPENMEVFLTGGEEFYYNHPVTVEVREIKFTENPDDSDKNQKKNVTYSKEKVIVIE